MLSLPPIVKKPDGYMAEGSSPALLAELLSVLEQEISTAGAPFRDWARPGIEGDVVADELSKVGLVASPELIVWFGWHNGFIDPPRPEGGSPMPNCVLTSLEAAVQIYREWVLDMVRPTGVEWDDVDLEWGAGKGWLRLVASTVGLAIDCTGNFGGPPKLHYASEDFAYEGQDVYRAVSLCTFVTWQIEGIRNGGYVWSNEKKRWFGETSKMPSTQRAARFW